MCLYPFVSVVTPTMRSRAKFVDLALQNISSQTYPHDRVEWVVVGDADSETEEVYLKVFAKLPTICCRYISCDIEGDIGRKRNFACSVTRYKVIASMDDDDIYNKEYLEYSVSEMKKRGVNIVGCRDMLVFFPLLGGKMMFVRGSSAHEATIVCRKKHWKMFKYREKCAHAEGSSMVAGSYFNEMDIKRIMVCVAHTENTYDKTRLLCSSEVKISEETRKSLLEVLQSFARIGL